jgi:hypothetical protein
MPAPMRATHPVRNSLIGPVRQADVKSNPNRRTDEVEIARLRLDFGSRSPI